VKKRNMNKIKEPLLASNVKQVIIMQGLSGSGKSYWVNKHFPNATVVSADRFFEQGPLEYHFIPGLLGKAHAWCMGNFIYALGRGDSTIVVDNTNTERWEWESYATLAELFDYKWGVADIYDSPAALTDEQLAVKNTHGVPAEAIAKQRERYEHASSEELILLPSLKLARPMRSTPDPTAIYRRNNNKPMGPDKKGKTTCTQQ